jgi:eukaryotic-like serine/threonine-protein kinase
MDYIAGRTLAEVVRDGPLPTLRAAAYVKAIAAAVQYAHEHGIIHRDLKSANVIIDEHGQPRITDFGLAKRVTSAGDFGFRVSDLTLNGQVLGSPNYLPPEQAEPKRGALGPASDVYALGAILYHLITGRAPFQGESLTAVLKQVLESDPISPRVLNPSIPRDLATICQKCLEKESSRRYPAARDLADELGRFLVHEPIRARPVGAAGQAWRWRRRQPGRASLLGALALVLFLGVGGIFSEWRRAQRERDTALHQAYAGDIKVAQLALEEGNLGLALRLLDKYWPHASSRSSVAGRRSNDRCGWEWRYLWGLCQSDEQSKLTQHTGGFSRLALSVDGHLLAVQEATGNIELWDWKGRRRLGTLTNQGYPPVMAFSPDGQVVASVNRGRDGKPSVRFWDPVRQRMVRDLLSLRSQGKFTGWTEFSPDGNTLLALSWDGWAELWRAPSWAEIEAAEAGGATP